MGAEPGSLSPPEVVILKKLEFFREGKSKKHVDDIGAVLRLLDVDRDTTAFNAVLAAMRLPKVTDTEKGVRDLALDDANRGATLTALPAAFGAAVIALALAMKAVPDDAALDQYMQNAVQVTLCRRAEAR